MIETSGYLIIQPTRRGHDGKVVGVELDRLVKTKPNRLGVRDIAIKIVLRVDEKLFTVPEPEVTIELDDRRALVVPKIDVVPVDDVCPVATCPEPTLWHILASDWRDRVANGKPIAIVGCGNPWHYRTNEAGRRLDEPDAGDFADVELAPRAPEVGP